ncbi:uncharacterized protein LOC110211009 [Phascolarctos cinereus]|uniref:Uncharacterized protein LOC110211009 n=1 Tax=Phascolarctos cinereus TaxID=38626 RepID=A0A6P5KMH0_PHACI|nr:uncharacterized protein LOC110211009 [Phascolarctos cinereus]XP_020845832.1 uncharacterized protein LOC110211009 [Phascolarctos cinereus]
MTSSLGSPTPRGASSIRVKGSRLRTTPLTGNGKLGAPCPSRRPDPCHLCGPQPARPGMMRGSPDQQTWRSVQGEESGRGNDRKKGGEAPDPGRMGPVHPRPFPSLRRGSPDEGPRLGAAREGGTQAGAPTPASLATSHLQPNL